MADVLFTIAVTWDLLLLLVAVVGYTLFVGFALWWYAARRPETAFTRFRSELIWPLRRLLEVIGAIWVALFLLALIKGFILLQPQGVPPPPILAFFADRAGAASLGAGALIVAMLGSPLVIWATVLKHRTVSFQKEGHMTDRISKAVEQLGAEKTVKTLTDGISSEKTDPNIEVRIGGLLSLERIAEDSMRFDSGRDHIRVMQIICAYLRQNSPVKEVDRSGSFAKNGVRKIDLQLTIDILGRRSVAQRNLEKMARYRPDLSNSDFSGLSFKGGHHSDYIMESCSFQKTDFSWSNLSNVDFSGSNFDKCQFNATVLKWTNFSFCTLRDYPGLGILEASDIRIFIDDADLSDMERLPARPANMFGSVNTKLPPEYAKHLADAMNFLRQPASQRNTTVHGLSVEARGYLHWYPYEHIDESYGQSRQSWMRRQGMRAWYLPD